MEQNILKNISLKLTLTLLETDHKHCYNCYQPDELMLRLQRIRTRLMRYNYKINFILSIQLILADCLSKNPLNNVNTDVNTDIVEEINCYESFLIINIFL